MSGPSTRKYAASRRPRRKTSSEVASPNVGIPDEEFGERLCACIEPELAAVVLVADVRTYLHERLANFKVPKDIQFHSVLPRETSGKIFKRKLRDPY